ncbi:insulin-degrading enzyme-like [Bolinopsis microptera]|uniref:insulin-degrading enzyme-like n=1 Tax=Bolinopsis microptera TaxID=2820187 RepID=UPI00307A00EB
MKGGYTPVPQANKDELDGETVYPKHRGKSRSYWRCFYGIVLIALGIGAGFAAWKVKEIHSNNIVAKPLYDHKLYKAIKLHNGMHILLIEDKESLLSGIGLDLQVGSMSDLSAGPQYLGLAHYTEHAMYMGSKEYPRFNELANFLQTHGGNDNAFTTQTHTNYYFYVNSRSIKHSIQIFAASFRSPLFDPSVLEGEKQAIQNELEKDIPQTGWKKFSILKLMSDPDHPFHRFNVGNKEIFDSADFVTKIRWFYNKYYSANLMNAVILSNLPLQEIEMMARKEFSTLPNRNITKPTFFSNPYPTGTKYINQFTVYENGALTQELELLFPIASSEEEMKLDHKLVLTILGDESQGTVTSHLRDLGYIIDLTVSTLTFPESFSCLTIQIHLTSTGSCNVRKIIRTVFDYIDLMKREITKSIWEDNFNLQGIRFNYHDESDLKTLLKTMPGWMSSASSPRYYLNNQLVHSKYKRGDIDRVLNKLNVNNLNVLQGGAGFDTMLCEFPSLDQYDTTFKTKYHSSSIPSSWIQYWQSEDHKTESLSIPDKNEFIPSDFTILPLSKLPQPSIILDEDGFKAYWKQDSSLPKSYVNCKFFIPDFSKDPRLVAILRLYLELVSESLDTVTYAASTAEYRYSLSPVSEGFKLRVEGFSDTDTFYKFLKFVVSALRDPPAITEMRFKYQVQEMVYDQLNKIYKDQPFRQGFYLARLFYQSYSYDNSLINSHILKLKQQQVLEGGRELLKKLAVKCFVFGNVDVREALNYAQFIRDEFLSHVMKSSYSYRGTVVVLPPGRWIWQVPVLNPTETNNCIFVINQITARTVSGPSLRKNILLTVLATIMKDPAYATLRTQEQLGYTVFTGTLKMLSVDYFYLLLQGSHYTPEVMMKRVVEFMHSYKDTLVELVANGTAEHPSGEEWFSTTKQEAINLLLSRPESQVGLAEYSSDTSQSNWPFFNRREYIITAGKGIRKEDLVEFYHNYIIGDARQLIVQLHGAGYPTHQNTSVPHKQILDKESIQKLKENLFPVNTEFVW